MDYRQEVGSYTAKGGFENEADIVIKFEDYKNEFDYLNIIEGKDIRFLDWSISNFEFLWKNSKKL